MRIRVIQQPREKCIDGIQLDRFRPGLQYEVGTVLAALFLAEGWAEPVDSIEPAVLIPMSEFRPDGPTSAVAPPTFAREIFPLYYDTPAVAADRKKRARHRHQ